MLRAVLGLKRCSGGGSRALSNSTCIRSLVWVSRFLSEATTSTPGRGSAPLAETTLRAQVTCLLLLADSSAVLEIQRLTNSCIWTRVAFRPRQKPALHRTEGRASSLCQVSALPLLAELGSSWGSCLLYCHCWHFGGGKSSLVELLPQKHS